MADGKRGMLSRTWSDPVGSKLIAGAIPLAATAIGARLSKDWGPTFVKTHEQIAYWALVVMLMTSLLAVGRIVWLWIGRPKTVRLIPAPDPHLILLSTNVTQADLAEGLTYPIKIYAEFRNESSSCVAVSIGTYTPGTVPLEKLVTDVLQLRLGNDWLPAENAADRVAVLPGGICRAWLAVKKARFDKAEQVRPLLGTAGTLVLTVNGTNREFRL